jgi:hypothetical protein
MTEEELRNILELAEWSEDYHGMSKDEELANGVRRLVAEIRRLQSNAATPESAP